MLTVTILLLVYNLVSSQAFFFLRPSTPSGDEVRFYLYTSPTISTELTSNSTLPLLPTKVLVHGWGGGDNHTFPRTLINAYFNSSLSSQINVVVVDWSSLADTKSYPAAVKSVKTVGRITSQFISGLRVNGSGLHLVGHSLGAHICGVAASLLAQEGVAVSRITGLDPAKPLFELAKLRHRLDSGDADFVDVIHTTGLTLGVFLPAGHADFYPNGGLTQPGCGDNLYCDHARAYKYYLESISNPRGFRACSCSSMIKMERGRCSCGAAEVADMGEFVSTRALGQYYLKTNSESPFAQG